MRLPLPLALLALLLNPAHAWELRGPEGAPTTVQVDASARFSPAPPAWDAARVSTDPEALAAAAAEALRYLRAHPEDPATGPGLFTELGVDRARVEQTLEWVVRIAEEDLAAGQPSRLQDPAFLAATFEHYRWTPDSAAAAARGLRLPPDQIRLTRYYVPQVEGRATPAPGFPVALYADPGPLLRERYVRAQVFDGAWNADPDGAAAVPLAWLPRAVAHDAMMQGTVEVRIPGADPILLNVDQHNGRTWRPGLGSEQQERLWYFRAVDRVRGWGRAGDPAQDKVGLAAGASVAGDIYNLGLGKLVALEDPKSGELRLVVLGDTGGAFQPNLFQLDDFAGAFPDQAALHQATAGRSGTVRAGVLLLR